MRDERNRGRVSLDRFLGDSVRAGYTGLRRAAAIIVTLIIGFPCWIGLVILSLVRECS